MTLSKLERFRRGLGCLPPNNWHQPGDGRGGVHAGVWMCQAWDVRLQRNGWWRAEYIYRDRYPIEQDEFATAEAAMRAVDVWCSEQWC